VWRSLSRCLEWLLLGGWRWRGEDRLVELGCMRATRAIVFRTGVRRTRHHKSLRHTMSSGSSGHNVTVPEPLSSILFLTRRIAAGWLY
jgi:hypothetical protein